VVVAAHRAIAVEQRLDAAFEKAGGRAERDDGLVDELQRQVLLVHVGEVADRRQAVDVARPVVDVVEADEPDVEREIRAPPREVGVHLRERQARELLLGAQANRDLAAAQPAEDPRTRLAARVTRGEHVGEVAVGDQAPRRRAPLELLHAREDRQPAAEPAHRPAADERLLLRIVGHLVDLHHAHGHRPPVGHVEPLGDEVAGLVLAAGAERALRRPGSHEHEHARPRVVPHLGVVERPRRDELPGGHAAFPAARRPRLARPDQVEPDRGADDVGLVEQVSG